MTNCFILTIKKLEKEGIKIPRYFGEFDIKKTKVFLKDWKYFIDKELHIKYFESFCNYTSIAKKNDIIIHKNGVGIAIDMYNFCTFSETLKKPYIENINNSHKILRVNNGNF